MLSHDGVTTGISCLAVHFIMLDTVPMRSVTVN